MNKNSYKTLMLKLKNKNPELSWSQEQHRNLWLKIRFFDAKHLRRAIEEICEKNLKPTPIMVYEKTAQFQKEKQEQDRHMVAAAFPSLPPKSECVSVEQIREFRKNFRYAKV